MLQALIHLLLKLLTEELLTLKKKYNVKRKTKVIKNINQNKAIETLNNQILEEFINKLSVKTFPAFKKSRSLSRESRASLRLPHTVGTPLVGRA